MRTQTEAIARAPSGAGPARRRGTRGPWAQRPYPRGTNTWGRGKPALQRITARCLAHCLAHYGREAISNRPRGNTTAVVASPGPFWRRRIVAPATNGSRQPLWTVIRLRSGRLPRTSIHGAHGGTVNLTKRSHAEKNCCSKAPTQPRSATLGVLAYAPTSHTARDWTLDMTCH